MYTYLVIIFIYSLITHALTVFCFLSRRRRRSISENGLPRPENTRQGFPDPFTRDPANTLKETAKDSLPERTRVYACSRATFSRALPSPSEISRIVHVCGTRRRCGIDIISHPSDIYYIHSPRRNAQLTHYRYDNTIYVALHAVIGTE